MPTIEFEGQRTPPEIISFTLNLCVGFKLSLRDVEDRLIEEEVERSYEAIRQWVKRTSRATRLQRLQHALEVTRKR